MKEFNQTPVDAEISELRWYKEVAALAFSNVSNYFEFDADGNVIRHKINECTPEMLAAIKKIKTNHKRIMVADTGVYAADHAIVTDVEIELYPKMRYIRLLEHLFEKQTVWQRVKGWFGL